MSVRFFETGMLSNDAITAIVYHDKRPVNIVYDQYYDFPSGKDLIDKAVLGFSDAAPFCENNIESKASEIEEKDNLICFVDDDGAATLYEDSMSCAGLSLFERCPDSCSGKSLQCGFITEAI